MKEYIKAMRLPACLFAGLTSLVSLRLAHHVSLLPILATIIIFIATMVQNDLRDRWNDCKKGKKFAFEHPAEFRFFATVVWIIAIFTGGLVCLANPLYLFVTVPMIAIGLIYSELEKIQFLSNALVAIALGLAAAYPLFDGKTNPEIWLLIAYVVIAMFYREILKDFDDREIDVGHKWTTLQKYGEEGAKDIVIFLLLFMDKLTEAITFPFLFARKGLFLVPAQDLFSGDLTPTFISKLKLRLDISLVILLLIFANIQ